MSVRTELDQIALGKLSELAPSAQMIAACFCGPAVYGKPTSCSGQDVMVVCEEYSQGLRAYLSVANGNETRFLLVDKSLMESDVRKGALGDFLTEKLLYPYRPLAKEEYLNELKVIAGTRVVKEEVRDLVLEYGEMCRGFVAKPEFFGLSWMRKRARAFIASMDEYLTLVDSEVRTQNVLALRNFFRKAIATMRGDAVELENDDITIADSAVDRWLKHRSSERVVNILTQSQRAFYSYLSRGRSIYLNLDLLGRELFGPLRLTFRQGLAHRAPEDPKNYLYLRTSERLVSLNERSSLEDVLSNLRPNRPITVAPLAGVLNEVFLVTIGKERFVAKKFTDWHGFKWFTLNLVSFGSKYFAVSGKSRMTNEYGINRFLARHGLKVPQIIHVSLKKRILVENYVPGTPMDEFITQAVSQSALTKNQYQLAESFGEALASIHNIRVSVGDSKPENFVAKANEVYAIDLEQARRGGDYAWDVAELLFYAGHYSTTPTLAGGLSQAIEAFIRGYARKRSVSDLKRAAGVRYAKAFSLWTPAPIILGISKMLREAR